jgi:hypothetical protein
MSIKHTTNLDQFKFHERNRRVNRSAVKKLAESIKRVGLKVPITVNSRNIILDGQHRVEAIRLLNSTATTPYKVSYVKKNMSIADIAEMNAHQIQWRMNDWIHFYATGGNENYIKLQEAAEQFKPHKLTSICAFLSPAEGAHTSIITSGSYVFEMTQEKKDILTKLKEYGKLNPAFVSKAVLLSIIDLRRLEGFSIDRLFHAIELNFESIITQSGRGNWSRHFVRFYNKGLRSGKLSTDDLPSSH